MPLNTLRWGSHRDALLGDVSALKILWQKKMAGCAWGCLAQVSQWYAVEPLKIFSLLCISGRKHVIKDGCIPATSYHHGFFRSSDVWEFLYLVYPPNLKPTLLLQLELCFPECLLASSVRIYDQRSSCVLLHFQPSCDCYTWDIIREWTECGY